MSADTVTDARKLDPVWGKIKLLPAILQLRSASEQIPSDTTLPRHWHSFTALSTRQSDHRKPRVKTTLRRKSFGSSCAESATSLEACRGGRQARGLLWRLQP